VVNLWLLIHKFTSNHKKYPNKSRYLPTKYWTKS